MTDDYCIDLIMGIAIADREENGMLHLMNVVYFENGEPSEILQSGDVNNRLIENMKFARQPKARSVGLDRV